MRVFTVFAQAGLEVYIRDFPSAGSLESYDMFARVFELCLRV